MKSELTYWKGNLARFTGKEIDLYGAHWLEVELLEGHKQGEKILINFSQREEKTWTKR